MTTARHPQDSPDNRRVTPTERNIARLLADVDRLATANRKLQARVTALEGVQWAAFKLLSTPIPHALLMAMDDRQLDAHERLREAVRQADEVTA